MPGGAAGEQEGRNSRGALRVRRRLGRRSPAVPCHALTGPRLVVQMIHGGSGQLCCFGPRLTTLAGGCLLQAKVNTLNEALMSRFVITTRSPRRTLLLILALSIVAVLVGARTPGRLSDTGNEFLSQGTQSYRTARTLEAEIGPVAFPNLSVILPEASSHAATVLATVQKVATLVPQVFHSWNGRVAIVVGYFHRGIAPGPTAARLARQFQPFAGVVVGGPALVQQELIEQTKTDVANAEIVAIPLLLVLALVVFRSLVAALLPALTAVIALSFTLLVLGAVNSIYSVSVLALNLVVGLTVGLSLDYSLLLISRYREELACGITPQQAASATMISAGRTVVISSATVAVAFASPVVFPIPFLRSLAIGGIVASIVAGLASLATLPAVFSVLGHRIDRLTVTSRVVSNHDLRRGMWYRLARRVMARPALTAVIASAALVGLGIPSVGLRLTGFNASSLPESTSSHKFAERVRTEFSHPLLDEVVVVAKGSTHTITTTVAHSLERLPDVATGIVTHVRHGLWLFNIKARTSPFSHASQLLVHDIRALPFHLAVTGATANYVDTASVLQSNLPVAFAILITLTLGLLYVATGSVILPFKALVMNMLSLASAFGLLVLVFQDGRFTALLEYHSLGAIVLTQPVLIGAGAFGVLTDYGVFMLTRIREEWDAGLSNAEAVALGMERTGPIISAAALLFCVAVGALIAAKMIFIKELGFGIVVAVAIDVTVVRALLVPSLMILLGRWNWWRPHILR